jgi:nitric oxide reductase subunit B
MEAPPAQGLAPEVRTQLALALACLLLALACGALAALHYLPSASAWMNARGGNFAELRPLHTTFASLWIFGAGIAVVYHWLATHHGGLGRTDRVRFRAHTACWALAGIGILVTTLLGYSRGREYLEFHPAWSALFAAGWILFAWNLLRRLSHGFWGQPIYLWFWTVGTLFFLVTFAEGHADLLPGVFASPVRDLQIQWKSCGTLVGSFNFLMYGSLTYVGERLSGDPRYAQSRTAFALFGVGCLNSFTNYAHHTYHLPQTPVVKWVAFLVSMAELAILWKVMLDLVRAVRARAARRACGRAIWFSGARWWIAAMLATSIAISVPSWNGLIHGTHVVVAHAMGTTIGIDTLVLLGCATWLLGETRAGAFLRGCDAHLHRRALPWIHAALAVLVLWLGIAGAVHGVSRWRGEATPDWVLASRWVLPVAGTCLGLLLAVVAGGLLRQLARDSGPFLFAMKRARSVAPPSEPCEARSVHARHLAARPEKLRE